MSYDYFSEGNFLFLTCTTKFKVCFFECVNISLVIDMVAACFGQNPIDIHDKRKETLEPDGGGLHFSGPVFRQPKLLG